MSTSPDEGHCPGLNRRARVVRIFPNAANWRRPVRALAAEQREAWSEVPGHGAAARAEEAPRREFAGATGVLYIDGETTDGGATFQGKITGDSAIPAKGGFTLDNCIAPSRCDTCVEHCGTRRTGAAACAYLVLG